MPSRHQIRLNGLEDAGVPRFERLDEDRKFVDAVAEDIRVAAAAPARLRHDVVLFADSLQVEEFRNDRKDERVVDDKNAFPLLPVGFS